MDLSIARPIAKTGAQGGVDETKYTFMTTIEWEMLINMGKHLQLRRTGRR